LLLNVTALTIMPEFLLPALLVAAAFFFFFLCRNPGKFGVSPAGLKDILACRAGERDYISGRYKMPADTAYKMEKLGIPVSYTAFLLVNIFLAAAVAAFCCLVLKNMPLAVISFVLWLFFAHQLVNRLYRDLVKAKIDSQAQLMLQLLAELFQVSDNLPQAIERIIPATPQPLKKALEQLVLQVRTNKDLDRCLLEFAEETDNHDIEIFVNGIIFSNHFGSDTHKVIAKNAEVIRERMELREELINETRGKKVIIYMFMIALPLLFTWLFVSSPDARNIFTQSLKGQSLVCILVLLEYACWYFDSKKGVADQL